MPRRLLVKQYTIAESFVSIVLLLAVDLHSPCIQRLPFVACIVADSKPSSVVVAKV